MPPWLCIAALLHISLLAYARPAFENTAVVRVTELGGSLVHVTTTYAARALAPSTGIYTIALGKTELAHTSWLEARIKGQKDILTVTDHEVQNLSGITLLDIALPKPLSVDSTVNIVVETVQTHATWPWPEVASQSGTQALKYKTDVLIPSPYHTLVQRLKLRSPSPNVLSYTTPEKLDAFAPDGVVTKSGATITYGPFHDIAPVSSDFVENTQEEAIVHYDYDHPVLEVSKLVRSAEISHWGANLNIQDEIYLHNAGPKLKGQFSRLEHQSQSFYQRPAAHVLPSLTLHLPAGIRDAYYYDLNGNVSTSRLRTVPSPPTKTQKTKQYSILELRPRYPLMGGWNYSFTLGWDAPLADSASYDPSTNKYLVQVPVLTEIPTAVVNDATVKIILPEGATDVDYIPPFPALSTELTRHITYLDTTGRPALVFRYRDLTDKHGKSIYVSYRVPSSAHLTKPVAVAGVFASLFILGSIARRVDLTINKKNL